MISTLVGNSLWGQVLWGQAGIATSSNADYNIEEALCYLLDNLETDDITIRPYFIEQSDQLPAVVYTLDDENIYQTQKGSAGLADATFTVTVYSRTSLQTLRIAEAIRGLTGFRGIIHNLEILTVVADNRKGGMDWLLRGRPGATFNQSWELFIKYRIAATN